MSYVQTSFSLYLNSKNSSLLKILIWKNLFIKFYTYTLGVLNSYSIKTILWDLNKYSYLYKINFLIFLKKTKINKQKFLNSLLITLTNNSSPKTIVFKNSWLIYKIKNKNFIFYFISILCNILLNYLSISTNLLIIKNFGNFFVLFSNFYLTPSFKRNLIS